jgi:hypothetical protein
LIRAHRPFIIRQVGDRTVYYQGQPILVDVLSAKGPSKNYFSVFGV